jgi:hypothetical protein
VTETEFSEALAKALRLCREAAGLKLPVEAMVEHLDDALAEADRQQAEELEVLIAILEAVGEVAAIGEKLPPEPKAAEPTYPMPGNLREA